MAVAVPHRSHVEFELVSRFILLEFSFDGGSQDPLDIVEGLCPTLLMGGPISS